MRRIAEWVRRGDQIAVRIVRKRRRGFRGNRPLHVGRLAEGVIARPDPTSDVTA